jgi:hypothetical protein
MKLRLWGMTFACAVINLSNCGYAYCQYPVMAHEACYFSSGSTETTTKGDTCQCPTDTTKTRWREADLINWIDERTSAYKCVPDQVGTGRKQAGSPARCDQPTNTVKNESTDTRCMVVKNGNTDDRCAFTYTYTVQRDGAKPKRIPGSVKAGSEDRTCYQFSPVLVFERATLSPNSAR